MGKSIAIKSAIVLAVVIVVYSAFWFFKAGQVEKQIQNFVNENSANLSVSEVEVSGFPISQKLTVKNIKFSFPTKILGNNQVIVDFLEAKAGIFSSEFEVTKLQGVVVQDTKNNNFVVKFNQNPKINIKIAEGTIAQFTYQDSGYSIVDADQNSIYSTGSSNINISSSDNGNDVITKVSVDVKDIENFGILNIYKNAFEEKIIEGIKTGDIIVNSSVVTDVVADNTSEVDEVAVADLQDVVDNQNNVVPATDSEASMANNPAEKVQDVSKKMVQSNPSQKPQKDTVVSEQNKAAPMPPVVVPDSKVKVAESVPSKPEVKSDVAAAKQKPLPAEKANNVQKAVKDADKKLPAVSADQKNTVAKVQAAPAKAEDISGSVNAAAAVPVEVANLVDDVKAKAMEVVEKVVMEKPLKSNLFMNIEYVFATIHSENSQLPTDPTQVEEISMQHSRSVKINNLKFSNSAYEISVNGNMTAFQDDTMPSGSISIKIDKFNNFLDRAVVLFDQIIEQEEPKVELQNVETVVGSEVSQDVVEVEEKSATDVVVAGTLDTKDYYQMFLSRVAANLDVVAKEIAAKNTVSNNDIAVFDIRREKNLEFLVNETTIREILGKF